MKKKSLKMVMHHPNFFISTVCKTRSSVNNFSFNIRLELLFFFNNHIIIFWQTLACLKPSGEQCEIKLDVDYKVFAKMNYSPDGKCAFLVAGSPRMFTKLIKLDVKSGTTSVIRATHTSDIDTAYYSVPKEVTWDTTDDAKAHGYYYPPQV